MTEIFVGDDCLYKEAKNSWNIFQQINKNENFTCESQFTRFRFLDTNLQTINNAYTEAISSDRHLSKEAFKVCGLLKEVV